MDIVIFYEHYYAPVAQLDRVPDYESGGYRFDSCRARHSREIAQFGSASGLGPEGRRFESCFPDQNISSHRKAVVFFFFSI